MDLERRVMVIGGVLGALLGVGAAYLYMRSVRVEEDNEGNKQLPSVQPGDAIKVTLGVLGVLKQIAGLGQGKK